MSEPLLQSSTLAVLLTRILEADGCSSEEARVVGEHLVDASLCGHPSHGVIRIIRYHQWLKDGDIRARQGLTRLVDSGSLLQLDGNRGMGQWLAREAVKIGMERASETGAALIAMRRAGHIGRVGAFAEQACADGFVSVHFINVAGSRLVAPFGAASRCISTAPVAIGVPNPGGDDFILDFATSVVAEGKAHVAARGGKPLPAGSLIDGDGRLTSDPSVLYGDTIDAPSPNARAGPGALRAMGEHKGSGLALACELLAGALTGNGTNGPNDHEFGNGMLSVLVHPDALEGGDAIAAEVRDYVDFVRAATPAEGVDRVLIPGDRERRLRERGLRDGLAVPEPVIAGILAVADELGVEASLEGLAV